MEGAAGPCLLRRLHHRGGPRANSGGPRPNAGRKRLPRLTADEATALLRELAPDARTAAEYARAVGCRPERVREALRAGCTVRRADEWVLWTGAGVDATPGEIGHKR